MRAVIHWIPAMLLGAVLGWQVADRVASEQMFGEREALAGELRQTFLQERGELEARIESDAQRLLVAESSIEALQNTLDSAERQRITDARELALYRRISSGDMPPGLVVDEVKLLPGKARILQITLVQSQGRDRIAGRLGIDLLIADGVASDSTSDDAEAGFFELVSPQSDQAPAFDLRFFQTVQISLPHEISIPAHAVLRVTVNPEGKRYKRFVHQIAWRDLATSQHP